MQISQHLRQAPDPFRALEGHVESSLTSLHDAVSSSDHLDAGDGLGRLFVEEEAPFTEDLAS